MGEIKRQQEVEKEEKTKWYFEFASWAPPQLVCGERILSLATVVVAAHSHFFRACVFSCSFTSFHFVPIFMAQVPLRDANNSVDFILDCVFFCLWCSAFPLVPVHIQFPDSSTSFSALICFDVRPVAVHCYLFTSIMWLCVSVCQLRSTVPNRRQIACFRFRLCTLFSIVLEKWKSKIATVELTMEMHFIVINCEAVEMRPLKRASFDQMTSNRIACDVATNDNPRIDTK